MNFFLDQWFCLHFKYKFEKKFKNLTLSGPFDVILRRTPLPVKDRAIIYVPTHIGPALFWGRKFITKSFFEIALVTRVFMLSSSIRFRFFLSKFEVSHTTQKKSQKSNKKGENMGNVERKLKNLIPLRIFLVTAKKPL